MRSPTIRALLGAVLLTVLAQPSSAPLGAQASKGVRVCLGTDNLLRFTSGDRCPQGQRMFRLAEVEDEVGITKEREDPPNTVVADLKTKIDFLSKRVANLEKDSPDVVGDLKSKVDLLTKRVTNLENDGTKRDPDPRAARQVTAPFEVVDGSGNPIFVVADAPHASVAQKGRLQIARTVGGGFSMLARNAAGRSVLGFGDTGDGGMLYVADAAGVTRVLGSTEGVKVYNKSDAAVVHLLSSAGGNGQLWLFDAGGRTMVTAGTDGSVGVVRAGPNMKCAPEAGLRVGDCLRGRP
jgi:hypothetical protein